MPQNREREVYIYKRALKPRFWPTGQGRLDPISHLLAGMQQHSMILTLLSCCTAVLAGHAPLAPPPPRDTIPFDYAWRFSLAPDSPPSPPSPPPTPPGPPLPPPDCSQFNTTNAATCSGLAPTVSGNASAAACRAACCREGGCTVFQYLVKGTNPTSNCWTGTCVSPLRGPTPGWVSGSVPTGPLPPHPIPPPPPTPPSKACGAECTVGFHDKGWDLVDAPHDYIITLPITNVRTWCVNSYARTCVYA